MHIWDIVGEGNMPYRIVVVCQRLETLTRLGVPYSTASACFNIECVHCGWRCTHIKPSIEHDPMRVPSWLNVTAVTGSECAGRVFRVFPTPH